jgi:hypothetical protein
MKIVAEYRQRAADCERLAEQIASESQRANILRIAASWHEMANQREQELEQRRREFLLDELDENGHAGAAH